MNGKFLLFFFVILNIVTVIMMGAFGQDTGLYSGVTDTFFETETINDEVRYTGNLSSNVSNELQNLRTPDKGLFESAASSFFNVVKMLVGFVGLITPFPFIALINSLNMAWYVTVIIALPLSMVWVVSLFEFVGNRRL